MRRSYGDERTSGTELVVLRSHSSRTKGGLNGREDGVGRGRHFVDICINPQERLHGDKSLYI